MVFSRYTTLLDGPLSNTKLTAGIKEAISKSGITPVSEFVGQRPNWANANHLVYQTPVTGVVMVLSVRTDYLLIEQYLGFNWDTGANKAASTTRDSLTEYVEPNAQLTIDVLKNDTALILSLRQGAYVGLYGYFASNKPDWWDASKYPNIFQFYGRNADLIMGFDSELNPYNQTNQNYFSSDDLNNLTPAGTRDVVPNFFLKPNDRNQIAGRSGSDLAKGCCAGTSAGDSLIKGTEEYLILTKDISSGLLARIK